MITNDLTLESAWTSGNGGLEYTARLLFAHPRLLPGDLTVLVVCEDHPFTSTDRRNAQHRLDNLGNALDGLLEQAAALLGASNMPEFSKSPTTATLMLTAGNTDRWTVAFDNPGHDSTLFVECVGHAVLRAWLAD